MMDEAIKLLKDYEDWEAQLILDGDCWDGEFPVIKNEHFDKLLELQTRRNKILNIEKEVGVSSTSTTKDGDLHGVSESNAKRVESTEEVQGNGSLEKITDTENLICPICKKSDYSLWEDGIYCNHCDNSSNWDKL